MSSSIARNIVELRQLLATKFPGVRMSADPRESISKRWVTGIERIDYFLEGGLPKGAITEVVSSGIASGASTFLASLVERARKNGEWLALVDATDSFDPGNLDNDALSRLLWVRCTNPKDAVKATDMLLHDGTLSLIVLDLLFSPAKEIRRIPSSTWFRLQRILDNATTALVVLAAEHMISNVAARLILEKRFSLESLDHSRERLVAQVAPTALAPVDQRIVKIA
ncbi:MAG TPA: hypothetical protein VF773_02680 [Verrucomicrobiae bacterium]